MREPARPVMQKRLQDFGPYRIVRRIATGGMAEIYLARQRGIEGLERTVVIKRILDRYADDAEFVTMFLDEARLLAALSHPHIAQVFDLGEVERTFYLTMEYVRGPVLGRLLAAARDAEPDGRLPRKEALGIGLAIAEALHYAHERRDEVGRRIDIVHRDLNPSNVIVSYDGAVKLIDFGIAKAATKVYETRAGVIKGTYGYIAPEQLAGSTPVDHRADVFALGILLYEMCVGVHPFDVSDEPNLIDRILEARYRRPREVQPDIPRDLDRLIASCLAPHPEGRPESMEAVIAALAAHLGEQGMVPTQTALATVTARLVGDDEGPRPLKPLTSPSRPRPFAKEPAHTQQLGVGGDGTGTAIVSPPTQPGGRAERPEKTAVAKLLPNSAGWREPASLDDEPLTLASGLGEPVGVVEAAPDPEGTREMRPRAAALDDEPPTMARARPLSRPSRAEADDDEEIPTRLMPLDPAVRAPIRPPTDVPGPDASTVAPVRARPRSAARRWTPVLLALGGFLGLAAVGGLTYLGFHFTGDRGTPIEGGEPSAGPAADGTTVREGTIDLDVLSEPAGATVHVDGQAAEGTTPLTLRLPPDARQVWLRLSKPGHIDQEREVSATVGEARFVLRPLEVGASAAPADEAPAGERAP